MYQVCSRGQSAFRARAWTELLPRPFPKDGLDFGITLSRHADRYGNDHEGHPSGSL